MTRRPLLSRLHAEASPADARFLQIFFKSGPGQYGEGDQFIGVRIPVLRKMLPLADGLPLKEIEKILHSPIHEERLLALLILVRHFKRGDEILRKSIIDLYLANTRWVNNWDLVDQSAYHLLGTWLLTHPRGILKRLAKSKSLWERRIAVVSTYTLIRNHEFEEIIHLSKTLLSDKEDLMHKACGWMLREVGNRDIKTLRNLLEEFAPAMPRTMLRYAIEKLPEPERQRLLARRDHQALQRLAS